MPQNEKSNMYLNYNKRYIADFTITLKRKNYDLVSMETTIYRIAKLPPINKNKNKNKGNLYFFFFFYLFSFAIFKIS